MRTTIYSVLAAMIFTTCAFANLAKASDEPVKRPPQFVLISFDGSYNHKFWQETLNIADKTHARFSYFISGVYFIKRKDKMLYTSPRHKQGTSGIGFGDDETQDIQARTEFVWQALDHGFDIGSHVNGHYDGGSFWTKDEWTSEFTQFHHFVEKVFDLNPDVIASFARQWQARLHAALTGFRAPLLEENNSTVQVLKDFNYQYDASGSSKSAWPSQKANGIWNLNLAEIQLAGTQHRTIAMDYNILYGQCNGKFKPSDSGECLSLTPGLMTHFETQMYQSYINTFLNSYYGNRAPLSIGHHFSLWNKGIYWKVLQRVIYDVCNQPEVQCVTHKDMLQWMNKTIAKNGKAYVTRLNRGDFDKSDTPTSVGEKLRVDPSDLNKVSQTNDVIPEIEAAAQRMMMKGDLPQAHAEEMQEVDMDQFRYTPSENSTPGNSSGGAL